MQNKYVYCEILFFIGLIHEMVGFSKGNDNIITIGIVMMIVAFLIGIAIASTNYLNGNK